MSEEYAENSVAASSESARHSCACKAEALITSDTPARERHKNVGV